MVILMPWGEVPTDFEEPDWDKKEKQHDWKNHISDRVIELWSTFTSEQKMAIAAQAEEAADDEEWE